MLAQPNLVYRDSLDRIVYEWPWPAFVLQSMDHFEDIGPSVVMASPGMMQSGLSRELFESWCTDKRNGVIIAGYCVEGTLAKVIFYSPTSVNACEFSNTISVHFI